MRLSLKFETTIVIVIVIATATGNSRAERNIKTVIEVPSHTHYFTFASSPTITSFVHCVTHDFMNSLEDNVISEPCNV